MARAKKQVDYIISEKGASKVKKGFKGVDGAMASAAKSAALYAAAYIGVRGIINLTKQAIEAFGIQERAEKKLEVALGGVNQSLLKQASALQQLTTFGDEAIIGVQASIAAFIDDEEAIKKTTEATLDFASAMGFDLKSAGDLIAKTLGSSTNALTRYGVEVTGAVGSTERLTTLTEGIAKLWGGQATADAETMAGAIQQAKNAAGDTAEDMGRLLAPAVIRISKGFKGAAKAVSGFIDALTDSEFQGDLEESERRFAKMAQDAFFFAASTRGIKAALVLRAEAQKALNEEDREAEELALLTHAALRTTGEEHKTLAGIISEVRMETVALMEVQRGQVELFDALTLEGSDLNTWLDDAIPLMDQFANSVAQAAIYGQSMGDAVVSSLKAISAQLVADAAIYALFTLFTGGSFSMAGLGLSLFPNSSSSPDMLPRATAPTTTNNSTTLNFSGNITDRAYVREFLIPEIQNAVRLNA